MDDGERPCGFGFLCSHVCFFGFIIVVVVVVGGACRLVSLFSARRKLELKLDEEPPGCHVSVCLRSVFWELVVGR